MAKVSNKESSQMSYKISDQGGIDENKLDQSKSSLFGGS